MIRKPWHRSIPVREQIYIYEEFLIRECLEKWVSELEPCLIFKNWRFAGLGLADRIDGKAKVIIKARKSDVLGRFYAFNASTPSDDD